MRFCVVTQYIICCGIEVHILLRRNSSSPVVCEFRISRFEIVNILVRILMQMKCNENFASFALIFHLTVLLRLAPNVVFLVCMLNDMMKCCCSGVNCIPRCNKKCIKDSQYYNLLCFVTGINNYAFVYTQSDLKMILLLFFILNRITSI